MRAEGGALAEGKLASQHKAAANPVYAQGLGWRVGLDGHVGGGPGAVIIVIRESAQPPAAASQSAESAGDAGRRRTRL